MVRDRILLLAVTAIALGGLTGTAMGQGSRAGGNPSAPRLMVGIFRSADKKLGVDAADAVRDRIGGDVSLRSLHVIPKQDVETTLESSGYSKTDALSAADANALARQTRADDYIEGLAVKTATGFQIQAFLILSRDQYLIQPLGTFDHVKLEGAAALVSKAFQDAQRVLEPEKRCRQLTREGKAPEALKEVTTGLQQYGKSIWLRVCHMQVLKDTKRPPAEIIKLAEEIVAVDSLNRHALSELVTQYDAMGNKDKKLAVLLKLYNADPTNPKLIGDVVNELAAMGKFAMARPIVERVVNENPGEVAYIQTWYKILAALSDTKMMAQVGEQMVRIDTSLADADFHDRQISAYLTDSNYQRAAEWAAKAADKYPKVASNWLRKGNLQRRMGETRQSVASLKRALEVDPKLKGPRMLILAAYVEMSHYDSAYTLMHEALTEGEDAGVIASTAVTIGNRLFAQANRATDKVVADFERVLPFVSFADSIAKDPATRGNAKFLVGVSSFFIGNIPYADLVKAKSCEGVKSSNDAFMTAQINLPAGGATNPQVTTQLLGALAQLLPNAEAAMKVFCKAETAPATKRPPRP